MNKIEATIRQHARIIADADEMLDALEDISPIVAQLNIVDRPKKDTPVSRKLQIIKEIRARCDAAIMNMLDQITDYDLIDKIFAAANEINAERAADRAALAKIKRERMERMNAHRANAQVADQVAVAA